jgi:carbonic anhydrase
MTPAEAVKRVMVNNDVFVREHKAGDFESYMNAQHPFVTFITCSDARVQTEGFLPYSSIDKVFVIRNIGNQIPNSEGSIDYGVLHLHTPLLFIVGHTHCGAIKAAMGDYSKETPGIKKELDALKIPIRGKVTEKAWLKNVEANVHYQVRYALKLYKHLVDEGKLVIIGGVYDFLNVYGKGHGRIVIIDVNGETNPMAIRKHPALKLLPADILKNCTL